MNRGLLFYFILSLIGYSIYVVMDAISKKLIADYHVSQIIFFNSLFSLVPIVIYITFKKGWREVKKFNYKIQIARSTCGLLAMIIFIISSNYLPLVTLYSVVFIFPLVLTIGANLFLGEVVGWRRYSAITLGFIGVIISINPFSVDFNKFILISFLSPVLAAAGWLIIKKFGQKESIFSFIFYGKLYLIIVTGLCLFYFFKSESGLDLQLNILSGLLRGIGILLTFIAASKLPSFLFAPTQYVQIITGAIIGYLYFGNIPTLNNYIGNLIVIGAGIYIIHREVKLSKKIVSQSLRPTILTIKKT